MPWALLQKEAQDLIADNSLSQWALSPHHLSVILMGKATTDSKVVFENLLFEFLEGRKKRGTFGFQYVFSDDWKA